VFPGNVGEDVGTGVGLTVGLGVGRFVGSGVGDSVGYGVFPGNVGNCDVGPTVVGA